MGDHTETLQVDFDPTQTSFRQLLEVFWASHNALGHSYSRQYRNAVFYADASQAEEARASLAALVVKYPFLAGRVGTQLLPLGHFTLAEEYHQKYKLKRHAVIVADLLAMLGSADALTHSTAAARLNGLVAGFGAVDADLSSLGLGPRGLVALRSLRAGGASRFRG